jgi:futalosine hydrolase
MTSNDVVWVHAAPREIAGAPDLPGRALQIGVGKTEAALHLVPALIAKPADLVVSFGIAGAYPGGGLDVGDVCIVTQERFADEGVETPDGFLSIDDLGLGDGGPYHAHVELSRRLAELLDVREVGGATVSTCSGTDEHSDALFARTGAAVETMEGAVVARVCEELRIPWVQLRAVSNRTGNRKSGGWNIEAALEALNHALRKIVAEGEGLLET